MLSLRGAVLFSVRVSRVRQLLHYRRPPYQTSDSVLVAVILLAIRRYPQQRRQSQDYPTHLFYKYYCLAILTNNCWRAIIGRWKIHVLNQILATE